MLIETRFCTNDLRSWQIQESHMFDHQYPSWCNAWKGSMFEMKAIAKQTTYISVCYHTQTWNLEQNPYRPLLSSLGKKRAWSFSNVLVCSMTKIAGVERHDGETIMIEWTILWYMLMSDTIIFCRAALQLKVSLFHNWFLYTINTVISYLLMRSCFETICIV